MKKLYLLIVMVSASVSVYAQHVNAGLKAGLSLTQMRFTLGEDSYSTDMTVGFQAGAYFTFTVSDLISIQPEVVYSRVGGEEKEAEGYNNDNEISLKYKLDYISVPVMFKFTVARDFYLQAGPQIGFLTAANASIKKDGNSGEASVTDMFTSVDVGANVGLGLAFNRLGFDARYQFGMSNIIKGNSEAIIFAPNVHAFNRVIQFTVSYRLTNN